MPFLTQAETNWKFIAIVVVLAVIAGAGMWFWIEIQEIPPVELLEVEVPERVEKEEVEKEAEEKEIEKFVNDFCQEQLTDIEPWLEQEHYYALVNLGQSEAKKLLIACNDGLDMGRFSFVYLLKSKEALYDEVVWQKNLSQERAINKPQIIDVDNDGINEILINYSSWGGTCTAFRAGYLLYSIERREEFRAASLLLMMTLPGPPRDDYYTIGERWEKDWGCVTEAKQIVFSENLKDAKNKIFREYFENVLLKEEIAKLSESPPPKTETEIEWELIWPDPDWTVYYSPMGFNIKHPPDWFLYEQEEQGFISTAEPEELLTNGILPLGHFKISFGRIKDYNSVEAFLSEEFGPTSNRVINHNHDIYLVASGGLVEARRIDYVCKTCEEQHVAEADAFLPGTEGKIVLFSQNDDSIVYFWLSYYANQLPRMLENSKQAFMRLVLTFGWQPATISIFIDPESFDLNKKTFKGQLWPAGENIKILTTETTKFYRTAEPGWQKDYFTFSEFQSLLKNWIGSPWPFTVTGIFEKEGVIKADVVYFIAQ